MLELRLVVLDLRQVHDLHHVGIDVHRFVPDDQLLIVLAAYVILAAQDAKRHVANQQLGVVHRRVYEILRVIVLELDHEIADLVIYLINNNIKMALLVIAEYSSALGNPIERLQVDLLVGLTVVPEGEVGRTNTKTLAIDAVLEVQDLVLDRLPPLVNCLRRPILLCEVHGEYPLLINK